jgi:hypothetical protein
MKKPTPHFKDYTFEEWQKLPFETKRDIWNNYWNPYQPEIGKSTREAILERFKLNYPKLMEHVIDFGFEYFGWNVGCIYVIVPRSSIRKSLLRFTLTKASCISELMRKLFLWIGVMVAQRQNLTQKSFPDRSKFLCSGLDSFRLISMAWCLFSGLEFCVL